MRSNLGRGFGRALGRFVVFSFAQRRPRNTRCFDCHRHKRLIVARARKQVLSPFGVLITMFGNRELNGSSAVYELAAQILVSSFPYSAKPGLSTGRVLPRDKPNPGRQCRPDVKCRPSSTAAIGAVATTGPTSGSVAKRLHRSSFRQISSSLRSIATMRVSNIWNSAMSALKFSLLIPVAGNQRPRH